MYPERNYQNTLAQQASNGGQIMGGAIGGSMPVVPDGPLHQKFKELSIVIDSARLSTTLLREKLGPVLGLSTSLSGGITSDEPPAQSEIEQMLVECIRAVVSLNSELGDLRGQLRI